MRSVREAWRIFGRLYFLQVTNQVLGFLTVPYLARTLGPEVYGEAAFTMGVVTYLNLLVQYGFDLSGPRRVARSSAQELKGLVAEILTGRLLLLSASLILAFSLLHIPALAEVSHFLLPFLGMVVAQALSLTWLLLGKGQVARVMVLETIQRTLVLLGIVLWVRSPEDGATYAFIVGATALLASGMGWLLALPFLNSQHPLPYSAVGFQALVAGFRALREGGWLFLSQGVLVLLSGGNAFLVGLFAGTHAVAQYAVAEKLVLSLYSFMHPVFRFYFPRLSSVMTERKTFLHLGRKALRVSLLFGGGLSLAMALGSPLLIAGLFGPGYEGAVWIARVLSLWLFLSALSLVWGHLALVALGYDRTHSLLLLGQAVVQIALASFLVPRWGGLGMALALVGSAGALVLGQALFLHFRVKVSPVFKEEP